MQIYYTFALFLENSYDLSEISQINSPINCINFYKQSFINMDNPHPNFWDKYRASVYFQEQFRKKQEFNNLMAPKFKMPLRQFYKPMPQKNEFFDITETILKVLPIPKGVLVISRRVCLK